MVKLRCIDIDMLEEVLQHVAEDEVVLAAPPITVTPPVPISDEVVEYEMEHC